MVKNNAQPYICQYDDNIMPDEMPVRRHTGILQPHRNFDDISINNRYVIARGIVLDLEQLT